MLAQLLQVEGATARAHPHGDLAPARMAALEAGACDCLILCFLDPAPTRASLLHVRRLKQAAKGLRVGVVVWQMPAGAVTEEEDRAMPDLSPRNARK